MNTPENIEEEPDDSEPAAEGDVQMEYYTDWLYSPNIGTVIKITCKILGQYRYCLIIHNIRYFNTCPILCKSD